MKKQQDNDRISWIISNLSKYKYNNERRKYKPMHVNDKLNFIEVNKCKVFVVQSLGRRC